MRIFSIDPTTAKDLDDALSIEWDEAKHLYRVGVHIADVSYFLRPGTALDMEARRRATTVRAWCSFSANRAIKAVF